MAPRVRAVILDLGNVLVFHDNALLFRRLGARAGGLSGPDVERRLMAGTLWTDANRGHLEREGIRREVCRALGANIPMDEFAPLFSSHFTLHDAVLPRVEGLVGRVPLLLLSNTNWLHVDHFRPRLPLLERFDHVLLSCAEGLVKPEPAFYEAALARAGCAPAEAAFFDDVPEYVDAASALGLRAHLFTTAAAFDAHLRALGL
jgi:putative hydrolase of the HAD superfamily